MTSLGETGNDKDSLFRLDLVILLSPVVDARKDRDIGTLFDNACIRLFLLNAFLRLSFLFDDRIVLSSLINTSSSDDSGVKDSRMPSWGP